MKLNDNFAIREMAGVTILIPLGREFQGVMAVSPVGSRIIEILKDNVFDELQILNILCEEYNASREQIRCDLQEFLEILREEHILVEDL